VFEFDFFSTPVGIFHLDGGGRDTLNAGLVAAADALEAEAKLKDPRRVLKKLQEHGMYQSNCNNVDVFPDQLPVGSPFSKLRAHIYTAIQQFMSSAMPTYGECANVFTAGALVLFNCSIIFVVMCVSFGCSYFWPKMLVLDVWMRLLLPATAPAVGIAGAECMVPAQKRADISFMTLDITSSWVSKTVRVDPTERITQYATLPTPFSLSANLLHWQRETHSPDAPWALLWNRSSFHMILDADWY
jgi:hypothetical protein